MKAHEFCYWLQGYFELDRQGTNMSELNRAQIECVQKHLALVFKHDIDPKYGDEAHQDELNLIHNPPDHMGGGGGGGTVYRC